MPQDSCQLATYSSKLDGDHDHMMNLRVEISVFLIYEASDVREGLNRGPYRPDPKRWDHG